MTVRLGDSHRSTPAPNSDFGPPDPVVDCEECGKAPWHASHSTSCPWNPRNPNYGYATKGN